MSCNFLINKNNREWKCPLCDPNELRLRAGIIDVSVDRGANYIMRRTIENGQQVIKAKISHVTGVTYLAGGPAPLDFTLPQGEFTLIKQ